MLLKVSFQLVTPIKHKIYMSAVVNSISSVLMNTFNLHASRIEELYCFKLVLTLYLSI